MAAIPVEDAEIDEQLFAELCLYCKQGHVEELHNVLAPYYETPAEPSTTRHGKKKSKKKQIKDSKKPKTVSDAILRYFYAHNQLGNTLIHEAIESDQADIVHLLLLRGVSPVVQARNGLTPLEIAASKGHVECIKAILHATGMSEAALLLHVQFHGK